MTADLVLDLKMRILPDNHRVYVLHPGDQKRFYEEFVTQQKIFLDLPGILLPSNPDINSEDVRRRLRMSRSVAAWYRKGAEASKEPSRDLADYAFKGQSPELPRYVREVEDLYRIASPGDLVVCPGPGYLSPVLIGEIKDHYDPAVTATHKIYQDDNIPARSVTWVGQQKLKRQYDGRLIKLMQNRQALIQITQDLDRHAIYEVAYGDYVWKNQSSSEVLITNSKIDLRNLTDGARLVNYFSAQFHAIELGELDAFGKLGFEEAIARYYDPELFEDTSISINSPGEISLICRRIALAGYIGAMLALSTLSIDAGEIEDRLAIVNSLTTEVSACDLDVTEKVRQSLNMNANYDLWRKEICPRRIAAGQSVGLKQGPEIK